MTSESSKKTAGLDFLELTVGGNEHSNDPVFLNDFGRAVAYSAVVEPILGASQIIDKAIGTEYGSTAEVFFKGLGVSAPRPVEFGTPEWGVEQLGSAVGMMLPFMAVSKVTKGIVTTFAGEARIAKGMSDIAILSRASFASVAQKEIVLAAATGFAYDALLRPSQQSKGETFIGSRVEAGLHGAIMFGSLTASNVWLHRQGLANPIGAGILSALPAGLISAEAHALSNGKLAPTWREMKESVAGLAFVGGTLGGVHLLAAQREGTARTNLDYALDNLTGNGSANRFDTQRTFKHLGNDSQINDFVGKVRAAQPAELVLDVREYLGTGLFGSSSAQSRGILARMGLWGEKYGDVRQMLLKHDGENLTAQTVGESGLIATCGPLDLQLRTRALFPSSATTDGAVWLSHIEPGKLTFSNRADAAPLLSSEPIRLGTELAPEAPLQTITRESLDQSFRGASADAIWEVIKDLPLREQTVVVDHLRFKSKTAGEILELKDALQLSAKVWQFASMMKIEVAQKLAPLIEGLSPGEQRTICNHVSWSGHAAKILPQLEGRDLRACAAVWKKQSSVGISDAEQLGQFVATFDAAAANAIVDYVCYEGKGRSKSIGSAIEGLAGRDLPLCASTWKHNPFVEPEMAQEIGKQLEAIDATRHAEVVNHLRSMFLSKPSDVQTELANRDLDSCSLVWQHNASVRANTAERLGRTLQEIDPGSHKSICDYVAKKSWDTEALLALEPRQLEGAAKVEEAGLSCRDPELAAQLWSVMAPLPEAQRALVGKHASAWRFSPETIAALHGVDIAKCVPVWEADPAMKPADAVRLGPYIDGMPEAVRKDAFSYVRVWEFKDELANVWQYNKNIGPQMAVELSRVLDRIAPESRKGVCDYVAADAPKDPYRLSEHLEGWQRKNNLDDCGRVWAHEAAIPPAVASELGKLIQALEPETQRAICAYARRHCPDVGTMSSNFGNGSIDLTKAATVWKTNPDAEPRLAVSMSRMVKTIRPEALPETLKEVQGYLEHLEEKRRYGTPTDFDSLCEKLAGRDLEACAKVWRINKNVASGVAEKLSPLLEGLDVPTASAVCQFVKKNKLKASDLDSFAGADLKRCVPVWQDAPTLHPLIAQEFSTMSPKDRIAASLAWAEVNAPAEPTTWALKKPQFDTAVGRFKEMNPKDLNEQFVQTSSDSLYMVLDSMRGPRPGRESGALSASEMVPLHRAISGEVERTNERAADQETRQVNQRQRDDARAPDPETQQVNQRQRDNERATDQETRQVNQRQRYFDVVKGLNNHTYHQALEFLRQSDATARATLPQRAVSTWEIDAACKLSITMGKDWNSWLDRCVKLGITKHDASYWLPLDPQASQNGLRTFLNQSLKEMDTPQQQYSLMNDIKLVSKRWNSLTEAARTTVLDRTTSVQDAAQAIRASQVYPNAKNPKFAIEAREWGVSKKAFANYEKRFMDSQTTPSPFPLEKTWQSGSLKGRFLPRSDVRGLFLGEHTNCCQHPGDAAASCAWFGQTNRKSGFFVVENNAGEIVAQSWAWIGDKGGLCFDSVESKGLGPRQGAVMDIYKKAANDLVLTHKLVTIGGTAYSPKLDISSLPDAGAKKLPLPEEHRQNTGYSDAKQRQVILAEQP